MQAESAGLLNRLLVLQEMFVGLGTLEPAALLEHVSRSVGWAFDGAALHAVNPQNLTPAPVIQRGRCALEPYGEVYLSYFPGPPEPRYLILADVDLRDPQEFRLCALFFEHVMAALEAAGYREELKKQALDDWLTGLHNRRALEETLRRGLPEGAVLGLVELEPHLFEGRSRAAQDVTLKQVAAALSGALGPGERAFRIADRRFALLLPAARPDVLEHVATDYAAVQLCWVGTGEAEGSLLDLAEQRLMGLTQPEPPGAPLNVTVHSRFEQIRLAYQQLIAPWNLSSPLHLIIDGPTGYALDTFGDALRPALIVTDSTSQGYLSDLYDLGPEGLLVGVDDKDALRLALEQVAAGEHLYQGPELIDLELYPREREVWRLVAQGWNNTQIAERLGVSEKTVANYVTNLQDKLFLNGRVELVLHYLGKLPQG